MRRVYLGYVGVVLVSAIVGSIVFADNCTPNCKEITCMKPSNPIGFACWLYEHAECSVLTPKWRVTSSSGGTCKADSVLTNRPATCPSCSAQCDLPSEASDCPAQTPNCTPGMNCCNNFGSSHPRHVCDFGTS